MIKIADYIPTACHFDETTLLTKSGSLVQIIKISGFEEDAATFQTQNMRDAVREAMVDIINTNERAVYLHVIRERRDMRPKSDKHPPLSGFAKEVDDAWSRKNNWDKQLVNSLYISLVTYPAKINSFNMLSLIPALLKKSFFTKCESKIDELNTRAVIVLDKLKRFGARKLAIVEKDGQLVSEMMSFYYNLVHLVEKDIPVAKQNLAEQVGDIDVNYHLNTLELTSTVGSKQFAAVYTVKTYSELMPEIYDKFLQLGQQFVLTQCLYPVSAKLALQDYQAAKEILDISTDPIIAEASGLQRLFAANKNGATDYCANQISITIHSDDYNFFNDKIAKTVKSLQEIGIAIVREDYNMASVFWSQLPGNMRYMKRFSYLDTPTVAGFTSIHHKKIGRYIGSKWGAPLTMFRNMDGNPFYLNFHVNDNGNTLIVGVSEAGKSTLARFFIAQSLRFQPRVIYLDLEGTAEKFMDAMEGVYVKLPYDEESPFKIDPLNLDVFAGNLQAAQNWLHQAIAPQDLAVGQYTEFFRILAEAVYNHVVVEGQPSRREMLISLISASADEILIEGCNKIIGSAIFSNLFASDELDLFASSNMLAFDLSGLFAEPNLLELFLPLVLEKTLNELDGQPTIVLLNRCIHAYQSPSFALRISSWLQQITTKNTIALMLTHYEDNLARNEFMAQSLQHFATKIFFADKYATHEYRKLFSLRDDELRTIKSYEKERRMFLLKQHGEEMLGAINLTGLSPHILKALL